MKAVWVSLLIMGCLLGLGLGQSASAQEYRFVRSVGQAPAVGEPRGLAVDQRGNVFVVDRVNGRILRVTGGTRMESAAFRTAGRLKRPTAVAIDRAGNLVVVDEAQGTVQHYGQAAGRHQYPLDDMRGKRSGVSILEVEFFSHRA